MDQIADAPVAKPHTHEAGISTAKTLLITVGGLLLLWSLGLAVAVALDATLNDVANTETSPGLNTEGTKTRFRNEGAAEVWRCDEPGSVSFGGCDLRARIAAATSKKD